LNPCDVVREQALPLPHEQTSVDAVERQCGRVMQAERIDAAVGIHHSTIGRGRRSTAVDPEDLARHSDIEIAIGTEAHGPGKRTSVAA
jgi:hypothetical protein